MTDYLEYMRQISSDKGSLAKVQYLKYNFSRFIKTDSSVLEIGPGLGEFLGFISNKRPSRIDVIDRDESMLAALKSKFKLQQVIQLSAEDIPSIRDQLSSYDLIFMLQIMEHIKTEALIPLLNTLYSCLKPGGHLLITVPNGANPLGIVERYSDITHINLFSENSLRQLARFAGIQNAEVSVQGYKIPATNILNCFRIALQFGLHFFLKLILAINGGVYFTPLHPNITLVVSKKA